MFTLPVIPVGSKVEPETPVPLQVPPEAPVIVELRSIAPAASHMVPGVVHAGLAGAGVTFTVIEAQVVVLHVPE